MKITNPYLQKVYQQVCQRDANEPEFLNAVTEVLGTLEPVILRHPEYEAAGLLERMVEPERAIQFRVAWQDDQGKTQVNRAWRVQFNSAIGPYKRRSAAASQPSTCRSSSSSALSRPSKTA